MYVYLTVKHKNRVKIKCEVDFFCRQCGAKRYDFIRVSAVSAGNLGTQREILCCHRYLISNPFGYSK